MKNDTLIILFWFKINIAANVGNQWYQLNDGNMNLKSKLDSTNIKKQIAEVKTDIFLNSAKSFLNNCPHFQAIMYTMNFNEVTIIKIFELNC